jgi:hypothetical protein
LPDSNIQQSIENCGTDAVKNRHEVLCRQLGKIIFDIYLFKENGFLEYA